jgi:hypothetical protein
MAKAKSSALPASAPPDLPRLNYTGPGSTPAANGWAERIGADRVGPRTWRIKAVQRPDGYEGVASNTIIRFAANGHAIENENNSQYLPDAFEAQAIRAEFSLLIFPHTIHKDDIWNAKTRDKSGNESVVDGAGFLDIRQGGVFPKWVMDIPKSDITIFRTAERKVCMVEFKTFIEDPYGEYEEGKNKKYVQFSPYSDGTWQQGYPDEGLPQWGWENYAGQDTLMIHEGAAKARHAHKMSNDIDSSGDTLREQNGLAGELFGVFHLGCMGGAVNPYAVDVDQINSKKFKRVICAADNDDIGLKYMRNIARRIDAPTFILNWNLDPLKRFPASYDMKDPMPDSLYIEVGGKRIYKGPLLEDLLTDVTFMTEMSKPHKGMTPQQIADFKPVEILKEHARNQVCYLTSQDKFVHIHRPEEEKEAPALNRYLSNRCFSSGRIADLFAKHGEMHAVAKASLPGHPFGIVEWNGGDYLNVYKPSKVRPIELPIDIFDEYLEFLCIDAEDRYNLKKSLFTLIARPEIKVPFGVLLLSVYEGGGKSFMINKVIPPLVGFRNCSFPSVKIINTPYNGYLANAKFVGIDELWSEDHRFATADALKSSVTQSEQSVVVKNGNPVFMPTPAQVWAASNHTDAMKFSGTDRRWFIPSLLQTPPKRCFACEEVIGKCPPECRCPAAQRMDKFTAFADWLDNKCGYEAIMYAAQNFGDYWNSGSNAPFTKRKREVMRENISPQEDMVTNFAKWALAQTMPVVINTTMLHDELVVQSANKKGISARALNAIIENAGLARHWEQIKTKGNSSLVLYNEAGREIAERHRDAENAVRNKVLRHYTKTLENYIAVLDDVPASGEGFEPGTANDGEPM